MVVAELTDGRHAGRGECVPYARYGETVAGVMAALGDDAATSSRSASTARALQQAMPPGAARNALDCAFWDLEAKRAGKPAHALAGLPAPQPLTTAYTISLGTPEAMAEAARAAAGRASCSRSSSAATGDPRAHRRGARGRAARRADRRRQRGLDRRTTSRPTSRPAPRPASRWSSSRCPPTTTPRSPPIERPIPVCADESVHDRASLAALVGRYDAVNIKLDKTGGLTEALAMAAEAERLGFRLMVGCMVATSLAMAPAVLLAQRARVVDLDGPLLLAKDRPDGLRYEGSLVHPPTPALVGMSMIQSDVMIMRRTLMIALAGEPPSALARRRAQTIRRGRSG